MDNDSALEIAAYGAWNGGTVVDNSIYEQMQLQFKGGIPVNNETIVERMGVRTRKAAGTDERIGVTALQDLLEKNDIDLSRVKLVIGATNVGDGTKVGETCSFNREPSWDGVACYIPG